MTEKTKAPDKPVTVITADGKRRKPRQGDQHIAHCPLCSQNTADGTEIQLCKPHADTLRQAFTKYSCPRCGWGTKRANYELLNDLRSKVSAIEQLEMPRDREDKGQSEVATQ